MSRCVLTQALSDEFSKVGFLDGVQPPAAVLGWVAEWVVGASDKAAIGGAVLGLQNRKGHDFIKDTGQLQGGLGAFELQLVKAAIESSVFSSRMAT